MSHVRAVFPRVREPGTPYRVLVKQTKRTKARSWQTAYEDGLTDFRSVLAGGTNFRAAVLVRSLSVAFVLALSSSGCGGSQKPAEEPNDPVVPLEGDQEGADQEAPPSSPEVKAAIDKIKAEQFAEAETILAKATSDSPEDPQAAFFYGVALEGVGKADQAAGQYRRAIELMPKLVESFQNLSHLLLAQEQFEQALEVAEAGLEQAPKDAPLLANRAIALDMLESPQAVDAYAKLLEVAPDDDANRFNYAVVLYINQQGDEAKAQLAKIKTQEMSLLVDMERLYLEMQDPAGCISLWDGVLAAQKSAAALTHRARCKLMSGDKKGGQEDLRAAVELDPKSSIANYYLGKLLEKDKKTAEAKKHFQVAAQAEDEFGKAAQAELAK